MQKFSNLNIFLSSRTKDTFLPCLSREFSANLKWWKIRVVLTRFNNIHFLTDIVQRYAFFLCLQRWMLKKMIKNVEWQLFVSNIEQISQINKQRRIPTETRHRRQFKAKGTELNSWQLKTNGSSSKVEGLNLGATAYRLYPE